MYHYQIACSLIYSYNRSNDNIKSNQCEPLPNSLYRAEKNHNKIYDDMWLGILQGPYASILINLHIFSFISRLNIPLFIS